MKNTTTQMTPLGNFLTQKSIGPFMNILLYLEDKDLKKLSFVLSSTRGEMMNNFRELMNLLMIGRKIEPTLFDIKYLSYHSFNREINLFIDAKSIPLNHMTETDVQTWNRFQGEDKFPKFPESNLFNLRFGISRGEKLSKEVLTTLFVKEKWGFYNLIEMFLEVYQETKFVMDMLPKKAIAMIISQDTHYLKILKLYKLFGFEFIQSLLSYLDFERYIKRFGKNSFIFHKRVQNLMDSYDEDANYRFPKEGLCDILEEGTTLYELIHKFKEEYPFIQDMVFGVSNSQKKSFDTIVLFIERALTDVEYLFDIHYS